jgi:TonB family protein
VKTDRAGQYDFSDLRPGSYTLSVSLPGFETYRAPMNLETGDYRERTLQLQIGSLQETITVTPGDAPPSYNTGAPRVAPPPPPPPPPAPAGTVRIGGNIKAPRKVRDVRPIYPVAEASQGAEGTVSLIATIGPDGYVRDITIVSSPNGDFAQAASDAVSQWQFTPTLLNGAPVDVRMRVSVYFKKN